MLVMKTQSTDGKRGAVLLIVVVMMVAFTLFISALLQAGGFNAMETERMVRQAQAFWLAEAGAAKCVADLYTQGNGWIAGSAALSRGTGTYSTVEFDSTNAVIAGVVTVGDESITNFIRIELAFTDMSYKEAVASLNKSGNPWTFMLGGIGNPVISGGSDPNSTSYRARGGADQIRGNTYAGVKGNIYLAGGSRVTPAPSPNTYGFNGDAGTSGGTITTVDSATIAGDRNTAVPIRAGPDLVAMNYPDNNTYDIEDEFDDNNGVLPFGHPLRDVVRRSGNNYYFEQRGNHGDTETLKLGAGVYYVNGDVWFDKNGPLKFIIEGTATIVASGNIHISDSLQYNNYSAEGDLLALIALGKYDSVGKLLSGGNIYFGDAQFGTLYAMDAFMFAANNFYYNFFSSDNTPGEPHTGFEVFGNFVALNQIQVYRDWYYEVKRENYQNHLYPRPAVYTAGVWKDALSGTTLTSEQKNGKTYGDYYYYDDAAKKWIEISGSGFPGMRHYRMIVKYDERINNPLTQPPGLPAAGSAEPGIFKGIVKWQHYADL
jgi:Tfp pilus assembly protein PilX